MPQKHAEGMIQSSPETSHCFLTALYASRSVDNTALLLCVRVSGAVQNEEKVNREMAAAIVLSKCPCSSLSLNVSLLPPVPCRRPNVLVQKQSAQEARIDKAMLARVSSMQRSWLNFSILTLCKVMQSCGFGLFACWQWRSRPFTFRFCRLDFLVLEVLESTVGHWLAAGTR